MSFILHLEGQCVSSDSINAKPVFFWLFIFSGKGTRVCIVGGGFGGLYTALQLAQLLPLQSEGERAKITLVDSGERYDMCNLQYPHLAACPDSRKTCTPTCYLWHRFVFLPMLYELVTGELKDWEVAPVFTDLLEGTPIEFVHGVCTSNFHRKPPPHVCICSCTPLRCVYSGTTSGLDLSTRCLKVDLAAVAGGGTTEVLLRFSISLSFSLPLFLSLSFSLPLFLAYMHKYTCILTHAHTHSLTHVLSLSPTHRISFFHSLTLPFLPQRFSSLMCSVAHSILPSLAFQVTQSTQSTHSFVLPPHFSMSLSLPSSIHPSPSSLPPFLQVTQNCVFSRDVLLIYIYMYMQTYIFISACNWYICVICRCIMTNWYWPLEFRP